ncbi:hypothetical protein [Chroococcidiopsis sp. TS-821]|uniref:hypothetical protein n=1 Tax=Chroococcidiopsis sp. TS-821 TaxID=1378066 RepID=UPI001AEF86EA|nr:hypothetical protein [Chroococcidiopsis sp. TS-821]
MSESVNVFTDPQHSPELEQLRRAGSIEHWLAAIIGSDGKVTAVDVNMRYRKYQTIKKQISGIVR